MVSGKFPKMRIVRQTKNRGVFIYLLLPSTRHFSATQGYGDKWLILFNSPVWKVERCGVWLATSAGRFSCYWLV